MKKYYLESRSRGLVTFCVETPSTMGYRRKDKRRVRSDRKMRRKRKKLLDDLKERRGYSHLKQEALGHTKWRAHFGRGFGSVIRQTTK